MGFAAVSHVNRVLRGHQEDNTPSVVLGTVLRISEYSLPLSWFAWFFLAMAYLFFAVRANRLRQDLSDI